RDKHMQKHSPYKRGGPSWAVWRTASTRSQVRGIANSKDSILIQGLIHGQRSVHGHSKVRSELSAMEHQNFLFDMEKIPAGSSTSVNNTTIRRAVDSRGECHGPAEAGLP
ncbi:hypothetical protein GW17_00010604, partial [Ensete ventricosum]